MELRLSEMIRKIYSGAEVPSFSDAELETLIQANTNDAALARELLLNLCCRPGKAENLKSSSCGLLVRLDATLEKIVKATTGRSSEHRVADDRQQICRKESKENNS